MNRGAAVLGTPAYSIFYSDILAVDRKLVEEGRMFHVKNEEDLSIIKYCKKKEIQIIKNHSLLEELLNEIFFKGD